MKRKILLLIPLFFFGACSSQPIGDLHTPEPGELEELKAVEAEKKAQPSDHAGLVAFFENLPKGLVVTSFHWDRPLSSENPGADCELHRRGDNSFACVVREGKEAIVLTMWEAAGPKGRMLSRVTLDGKGSSTRERWIADLLQNNYTLGSEIVQAGKLQKTPYLSSDKLTRVDVIWANDQQAVTLVFKAVPQTPPAAPEKKSPSKGPNSKSK